MNQNEYLKAENKVQSGKKKRRLYLLSTLCIIPVFGVIMAAILIYYGIFKFKDFKLVIIGVIAIVYTIIVVDRLNYRLKYGEDFNQGMTIITTDELDQLSDNLEIYKLKYGNYPDSLQQLSKEDKQISIRDPLPERNFKSPKIQNFFYKKSGDKYVLFSTGIDGIPYTKDDVFPRKVLKHLDDTSR